MFFTIRIQGHETPHLLLRVLRNYCNLLINISVTVVEVKESLVKSDLFPCFVLVSSFKSCIYLELYYYRTNDLDK